MNVATKILLPLCSSILIGMLFIAYQTYTMSSENMQQAQQELNVMAVNNTISELNGIHEFNVLNAISLSQTGLFQPYFTGTPAEVDANTQGAIDRIVNMRKTYSYAMIGIVNTDGIVLQHTEKDRIGKNISNDHVFTSAMRGEVSAGIPFLFNGRIVYTVSAPVYKTGTKDIIGVVFNATYIDDSFSKRIPLGQKGSFLVADKSGLVFLHSDPNQILQLNLKNTPWGKNILQNHTGNITFNVDGEEKFAYFNEQKDTGWIAVAALDVKESSESSLALGQRIFLIAAIVTVFIVLVTGVCVLNMRKSLLISVNFARDIANGKLDTQLKNTSSDELGVLACSLQNIAEVLQTIIHEYNKLEQGVKNGDLLVKGDVQRFNGEFASLVQGTNAIIDSYLTIINNIPSPVVVLDNRLRAKYINDAGIKLAGTDYINKPCKQLFSREDDGTATDGLQNALRLKIAQRGETKAHPQAGVFDVIYNAIPLLDRQSGQVNAMLQLITDVTEFKATQETIMHVAEQATFISAQVATASQQLEAQLKHSEEIAATQASRASEASHVMHIMNTDVTNMAALAQDASKASTDAKQEAETGSEVVEKAVKSIQLVEKQSQNLKEGMERLSTSANAINEVITTISDIADQTNLLALNAAIEAARAGESGRGFAVVADEVRKLAEKTMASTIEVQNAIIAIQKSVSSSVSQVNDSVHEVYQTSQLVSETGTVFKTIMNMVENTSEKAYSIAESSIEQREHSENVNEALTEVSGLASQTAMSMEESLNAIGQLSSQSQALQELIENMKKQ